MLAHSGRASIANGNFLIDEIMRLLRYVASYITQQPSTDRRNWPALIFTTVRLGYPQVRSRVFQTKKMKAAITPTTISIQF